MSKYSKLYSLLYVKIVVFSFLWNVRGKPKGKLARYASWPFKDAWFGDIL